MLFLGLIFSGIVRRFGWRKRRGKKGRRFSQQAADKTAFFLWKGN
jgi:hypothetical protein